jgi:hypothetical protein
VTNHATALPRVIASTLSDAGAAYNAPPEKREIPVPTLLGCVMASNWCVHVHPHTTVAGKSESQWKMMNPPVYFCRAQQESLTRSMNEKF